MMTTVGERLKWIREKHGFTQQKVADALELDRSTYAKMESRKVNRINLSLLPALMSLYSLDERFFLTGSNDADAELRTINLDDEEDAEIEPERGEGAESEYVYSEVQDVAVSLRGWATAQELGDFVMWVHPRINKKGTFYMDGAKRRAFLRERLRSERILWEEGKKKK